MFKSISFKRPYLLLFPVFGMGIFILLYILAALVYPGGSGSILSQHGFSFWNNYLCDLLDFYAVNGEVNTARILARIGLFVLCISLIILWYHLPKLFVIKSVNLIIMKICGILALITILFLAIGTHDLIVRIAGVLGVIAFITSFIELFKNSFYKLAAFGIFCLIIFLINYYIYETGSYLETLPVIQKITFLVYILWFGFLDIALFQSVNSNNKHGHE